MIAEDFRSHLFITSKDLIITMKRYLNTSASIAIMATFLATGAQASDLFGGSAKDAPGEVVSYKAPTNWTGFYIGGRAGYGNANHDLTLEGFDGNENGTIFGKPIVGEAGGTVDILGLDGVNSPGFVGGGQVGFDKQMGRFVIGAFGTYDFANMKTTFTALGDQSTIAEKDYEWSAGLRGGVLVNPNTLVYILAAYTETEYKIDDDFDHKFQGVTVGGGIEFAATNNVFLGLEATHTFFDEETLISEDIPYADCTPSCDQLNLKDELGETKIMGTLKIKLNSGLLGN